MNCERCQELVSDFVDGSLSSDDEVKLNLHFDECLDCAAVRRDLESIVGVCHAQRGEYPTPPNERAVWLRIRNTIEAERNVVVAGAGVSRAPFLSRWLSHSWQLSLPQLAASVAAIAVIVSLTTVVGLRRIDRSDKATVANAEPAPFDLERRNSGQQQAIKYWNARIDVNKARWNPQLRDTFDRNLGVIDQAVNDSLRELNKNPHDEVSEEMLNAALNEKIALLQEFSQL